jgi:hypothetical protein
VIASSRTQAGDRRAKHWLLTPLFALLVLATACGGAGDPGTGGGGGGGGGGDAGSGTAADLGGQNGATALVDGVRVTATDNVASVLATGGFVFTASSDNAAGTDVEDVWQVIGALVAGPQACGDDVTVTLVRAEGGQSFIPVSCTVELDDFEAIDAAPGPIEGRFSGTLANPLTFTQVTVTNGVFLYAEPAP